MSPIARLRAAAFSGEENGLVSPFLEYQITRTHRFVVGRHPSVHSASHSRLSSTKFDRPHGDVYRVGRGYLLRSPGPGTIPPPSNEFFSGLAHWFTFIRSRETRMDFILTGT